VGGPIKLFGVSKEINSWYSRCMYIFSRAFMGETGPCNATYDVEVTYGGSHTCPPLPLWVESPSACHYA